MSLRSLLDRKKPRRKIQGMAAALLPYEADGRVAVDAFSEHLQLTHRSGLMSAVNMDTGYVNYLSAAEKKEVLRWTREALGNDVPFVAGAYIENESGDDVVALYRREMDAIVERSAEFRFCFKPRGYTENQRKRKRLSTAQCAPAILDVLAFELGRMFAPNGEIFNEETVRLLMDIPEITGMKHSSLDRIVELERLALRDKQRPEFIIYTGNDLGIDMIEYGSDYLLGLAAFAPEKFAERDRLWQVGDPRYYACSDALQYLGNVAFRDPVPAYKHSAATFLHLIGRAPTADTHPRNVQRPAWEAEILRDCARRLGY